MSWESWESSELRRWERERVVRWERCERVMMWQGGKGVRIVRWQGWRGEGEGGGRVRWKIGKGGRVVRWQGGKGGRVVGWQGRRFLVLFKGQGRMVGPRYLFVSVNQRNEGAGCVQDFLAWLQGWKDSPQILWKLLKM